MKLEVKEKLGNPFRSRVISSLSTPRMSSTPRCLNNDQSDLARFLVDRRVNQLFSECESVGYSLPVLIEAPICLLGKETSDFVNWCSQPCSNKQPSKLFLSRIVVQTELFAYFATANQKINDAK